MEIFFFFRRPLMTRASHFRTPNKNETNKNSDASPSLAFPTFA